VEIFIQPGHSCAELGQDPAVPDVPAAAPPPKTPVKTPALAAQTPMMATRATPPMPEPTPTPILAPCERPDVSVAFVALEEGAAVNIGVGE
jgi:hypothetical protein